MTVQTDRIAESPLVTIMSDSDSEAELLCRTVEAAGAQVHHRLDLAGARRWLEAGRPTQAIILHLSGQAAGEALNVAEAMTRHAEQEYCPAILSGRIESIDALAPLAFGRNVTLLCEPGLDDHLAALALVLHDTHPHLSDISSDMDPQRLRRLADEVSRIARTLASLSGPQPSAGFSASSVADAPVSFNAEPFDFDHRDATTADDVRKMLRLRRLRERYFDPALFADPAWDMLLDLMAARLEQVQVAVSSLCIAAAVPPTTALRWIKAMCEHGLFDRCADPDDGRRIFIRLSDAAMASMTRYFSAMRALGGVMI